MDAALEYAEMASSLTYADLPETTIECTQRSVLDTLGVTLGATGLAGDDVHAAVDVGIAFGGVPSCTVLGRRARSSPYVAAYASGVYAHALDYDDVVDVAAAHPSAPTVSAVLALAEHLGDVDGEQFLVAVTAGIDLIVRVGSASDATVIDHGWLPSLIGVFGAAVACARLLELSPERTSWAMGLALHQVAGTAQCGIGTGSSFRAIRDGFTAKAGLMSALMAQAGVRGDREAFEGTHGYFQNFVAGAYDRQRLVEGLGRVFGGEEVGYKAWPCCGYSQFFITALQTILEREPIQVDQVERIIAIGTGDVVRQQCEPKAERVAPTASMDAKFSLPFQIGKYLVHRDLTLGDFTAGGFNDKRAIAVAERVEWRIDPEIGTGRLGPGAVEIHLADGRVITETALRAVGHPSRPLEREQLVAKFRDAVAHARPVLTEHTAEELVGLTLGLSSIKDMRDLLRPVARDYEAASTMSAGWREEATGNES